MSVQMGINGFGRIGRQVLKIVLERHAGDLEVVAVNDLWDPNTNAQLFKYDSTYGKFDGTVDVVDGNLVVNGILAGPQRHVVIECLLRTAFGNCRLHSCIGTARGD